MSRVVWITAAPRVAATGAPVTVRLAGGGRDKPYRHPVTGEQHRAGVAKLPRFRASLDFDENGWTGGTVPQTGRIRFAPAEKAVLTAMAAYHWPDAAITIELGAEGGAPALLLTGSVAAIGVDDVGLDIEVADLSKAIDKPIASGRFAGSGGIEGGAEAKERIKRRSWGRVFNVEGRVLDKTTNVYEFGDPAHPLAAFTALRDLGRDGTFETLPWQGSAAATLTALKASEPEEGGGVVAPSIACAKWWTQPVGPLTADLNGEIGAGYVETVPEIAARISAAASGPAITNVAAIGAVRPDPAGLHIAEGNETAAAALDRLLLGASLLWVLQPGGTILLREWSFAAPAETIASRAVKRTRSFQPMKARRVGYKRASRIHSDSEIAAVLLPVSGLFRGDWAPDTAYAVDDLFVHGGATYRVTTAHTSDEGDEPPNDNVEVLPGSGGAGAISAGLTNESHDVPAEADGTVLSYVGAGGQFFVFLGTTDVTEDCTFAIEENPQGLTGPFSGSPLSAATGAYQVIGGLGPGEDSATLTIRATHGPSEAQVAKVFSLGKSKGGASAKLISLSAAPQNFRYNGEGELQAQSTTLTVARQNIADVPYFSFYGLAGNLWATATAEDWTGFAGFSSTGPDNLTISEAAFTYICGSVGSVGFVVAASAEGRTDRTTIGALSDGAPGADGIDGTDGEDGAPGLSIAELSVFKRSATVPSTPEGGSYNVGTKVLTPPSSWTKVPEPGDQPLYEARGTAALQGLTGTTEPIWFGVGLIAANGEDGASGSSTDVIFRRSATQPATPAASEGVPPGWYTNVADVPSSANPMWTSFGKRADPDDDWTWNVPVKIEGKDGSDGTDGTDGTNGVDGAPGEHGGFGWTAIANGIVEGNTLRRESPTNNYDAAAVGPAFQDGLFVQQKNFQADVWQMLALDNDATSYDYAQQTYQLTVRGQQYWLYVNGELALNWSNIALLGSRNIRLQTNRAVVKCFADQIEVFSYAHKLAAGVSLFPKVIAYGHTGTITELNAGPIGAAPILGENVVDSGGAPIVEIDVITDQSPLLEHIGSSGRVVYPAGFYDVPTLAGINSTTNLAASYSANGSNWTVNLPAHTRKYAGPSGPISLYYGAGSGVVAPNTRWYAYIIDVGLTGISSPTINFTTNADDLLQPGAYLVSAGYSPATGTADPPPPGTGGGGGGGGGNRYGDIPEAL